MATPGAKFMTKKFSLDDAKTVIDFKVYYLNKKLFIKFFRFGILQDKRDLDP